MTTNTAAVYSLIKPAGRLADAAVLLAFNAVLVLSAYVAINLPFSPVPITGQTFGVLLAYADADPFISGAVNALRMFQDITAYLGATLAGSVYGSAYEPGEISENRDLLDAAYDLGAKLGSGG